MGYFSNGSEGDVYEHKYCSHCVHYHLGQWDEGCCAVWNAHMIGNYKQIENHDLATVLDLLIPSDERSFPTKCAMYLATQVAPSS